MRYWLLRAQKSPLLRFELSDADPLFRHKPLHEFHSHLLISHTFMEMQHPRTIVHVCLFQHFIPKISSHDGMNEQMNEEV